MEPSTQHVCAECTQLTFFGHNCNSEQRSLKQNPCRLVIFLCFVKPIIIHKQFTLQQKEHSKMIERNKFNSVGCHTGKLKNYISHYHLHFFPSWCSCNVLFPAWRVSVGADKSRFKSEGCLGQLLSAAYTASAGASKTEDTVM